MIKDKDTKTVWIKDFKGFSNRVIPSDEPVITDSMSNVKTQHGRIMGRGGMTPWNNITTADAQFIHAMFNYRKVNGSHFAMRLTDTTIQYYSAGSWQALSGYSEASQAALFPISTIIDDTLIFTNGQIQPNKWAGTGAVARIAGGVSPYGRGVIAYMGFLFVYNVSDNGAFNDVDEGYRIGRYADDWDGSWDNCSGQGHEINLDETPGSWVNSVVLDPYLFALKSDGVVAVKWVGGEQVFQQQGVPSDVGILAPLSLAAVGLPAQIAFYLGTDGFIYQISSKGVESVTDETLFETLPDLLSTTTLKYARAIIDSRNDIYYLFYSTIDTGNQCTNAYISYNYKSKELQKGLVPNSIIAGIAYKPTDTSPEVLLVSTGCYPIAG